MANVAASENNHPSLIANPEFPHFYDQESTPGEAAAPELYAFSGLRRVSAPEAQQPEAQQPPQSDVQTSEKSVGLNEPTLAKYGLYDGVKMGLDQTLQILEQDPSYADILAFSAPSYFPGKNPVDNFRGEGWCCCYKVPTQVKQARSMKFLYDEVDAGLAGSTTAAHRRDLHKHGKSSRWFCG